MTDKKKGLGRGLSALIPPPKPSSAGADVIVCAVSDLRPNRFQPRSTINETALDELAASIKASGIINPITVRKNDQGYEIIAGERRWRAAMKAGLQRVPVMIREANDQELLVWALIENMQRDDLNPMEEAQGYKHLLEQFGLTQEEIAKRMGKDRSTVANSLRLVKLPLSVQEALRNGIISAGHARAILALPTASLQEKTLKDIIARDLSVRQAEALVQNTAKKEKKPRRRKLDPELQRIEDSLKRALGTRVRVHDQGGKGRIEVEYYSWEDLDRILEHIER